MKNSTIPCTLKLISSHHIFAWTDTRRTSNKKIKYIGCKTTWAFGVEPVIRRTNRLKNFCICVFDVNVYRLYDWYENHIVQVVDKDGDDMVTFDEFKSSFEEHGRKAFGLLDADEDRWIS